MHEEFEKWYKSNFQGDVSFERGLMNPYNYKDKLLDNMYEGFRGGLSTKTLKNTPQYTSKHNHYFKDVSHLKHIDVYRVLELFEVSDPCLQHAIKKLLVAGGRGAGKDFEQDIREAVDSLNRKLQMIAEDCNK